MSNILKDEKKTRISYSLPEAILYDIKQNMSLHGYDLKSKSKWISEAITSLLSFENFVDLVLINDQMKGFEKLDAFSITKDFKLKLDDAILQVRKCHPIIEGVQSKIIRTAIVQRLLRS